MHENGIVILDFGSQFTQLITRRIRSQRVYSQILPFSASKADVFASRPRGLILSGGPSSVFDAKAPALPDWFDAVDVPVLGICYGMQLLLHKLGAPVERSDVGEYGHTDITTLNDRSLFSGMAERFRAWMSHGDKVLDAPEGVEILAESIASARFRVSRIGSGDSCCWSRLRL